MSRGPCPLCAGHITFGCLNNFCKATAATLTTWARLLQALPSARLLLNAPGGSARQNVLNLFAAEGIAAARLSFVDRSSLTDYFRTYGSIDVALDPFPFGGGTTTCDALWMGVPVVSLAGQAAFSRGGLSILSNVGVAELVAQSQEDYVRIALALANDIPRLSALRGSLRGRMKNSPLMHASQFARDVELVYGAMWRRWCLGQQSGRARRASRET